MKTLGRFLGMTLFSAVILGLGLAILGAMSLVALGVAGAAYDWLMSLPPMWRDVAIGAGLLFIAAAMSMGVIFMREDQRQRSFQAQKEAEARAASARWRAEEAAMRARQSKEQKIAQLLAGTYGHSVDAGLMDKIMETIDGED